MIAVSDASPLIALLRVRRVELLREVFGRVVVPDAVWHEIAEAGKDKAGGEGFASLKWIDRCSVSDQSLVSLLRQNLGAGEAEAIVLAREAGADFLIMDERLGRTAAKNLGLNVVGLVGVLSEARRRGILQDADELMDRLRDGAGFWLSDDLRKFVTG